MWRDRSSDRNVSQRDFVAVACAAMEFQVPDAIDCVDCGYECHRLTPEPEEGFASGAIVAYRCSGCLDRWDVEFETGKG